MTTKIHVNQHVLKANRKTGERNPPITVKQGKKNTYGKTVVIYDADGFAVAKVVYSPDKPLSCGATCWVEAFNEVHVE